MKLEDLIVDKFYCTKNNAGANTYYFKYRGHDDRYIKCSGYYLGIYGTNDTIHYYEHPYSFIEVLFANKYLDFQEIYIEQIIDYLPEDNIDKKCYFRTKRIESLLNL